MIPVVIDVYFRSVVSSCIRLVIQTIELFLRKAIHLRSVQLLRETERQTDTET